MPWWKRRYTLLSIARAFTCRNVKSRRGRTFRAMMNPILCYSKQYTNQGIQASPRPGNFFRDFGVFFQEQLNDDLSSLSATETRNQLMLPRRICGLHPLTSSGEIAAPHFLPHPYPTIKRKSTQKIGCPEIKFRDYLEVPKKTGPRKLCFREQGVYMTI